MVGQISSSRAKWWRSSVEWQTPSSTSKDDDDEMKKHNRTVIESLNQNGNKDCKGLDTLTGNWKKKKVKVEILSKWWKPKTQSTS